MLAESSAFGLEEGHQVELSFVRLDDDTRRALEAFSDDPDIVEKVEGAIRDRVDRTVPLDSDSEEIGVDIEDQAAIDLEAALGRPATPEELEKEVDHRLDELVDEQVPDFVTNELPELLEQEIAQVLRFDLAPEEMIALQRAGIVALDGVEIIVRRAKDGTETPYYRDHPDGNPADNLLALPHYSPPYVPEGEGINSTDVRTSKPAPELID